MRFDTWSMPKASRSDGRTRHVVNRLVGVWRFQLRLHVMCHASPHIGDRWVM